MKVMQEFSDKTAISLSMICLIHCLVFPSFLVILSGYFTLSYENELFHYLLLLIAIPLSFYALVNGARNHSNFMYLMMGIVGISSLIFAVTMGVELWNESGEIVFTSFGASLVAFCHYKNYKLCREVECDSCH